MEYGSGTCNVEFLSKYPIDDNGITAVDIPEGATHFRIKKRGFYVYHIDGPTEDGYRKIGGRKARISSEKHMKNIARSVGWV